MKCAGTEKKYKQCPVCGKEFVFNADRSEYCSVKCAAKFSGEKRKIYSDKKAAKRAQYERMRERTKSDREAKQRKKAEERAEREALRIAEQERKKTKKIHPCPVCNSTTDRLKYCSDKCSKNAQNNRHESIRRAKIKGALVDRDISLMDVYNNDMGICYICGEKCSYDDKYERDGTVIVGLTYPTIDHVVPLSKGGLHAWSNVRLACKDCNSKKSDAVLYPAPSDRHARGGRT
ncbi:MAG: HNH endonuclease, partial [Oscillospiraceae bacterium]|nr:HNH endonuclease [Lachnospiraceae bacterium]MBO7727963.1 HNH endonuclease [Oscillospiraceae bacterium]